MPEKHSRKDSKAKRPVKRAKPVLHDLPELQQARALWAQNRLIEAVSVFDQVARRHPNNIRAMVDAGRAFASLYQYERAEELLNRAVRLGAKTALALHLAGQSFRLIRRHSKAIDCFQAALQLVPDMADSHLELALLFERQNELDPAERHCKARLNSAPDDAEASYLQGRILRRRGSFGRADAILTATAEASQHHWLTRARCFAELAKSLDQQQRYIEAWKTVIDAKQLLAAEAEPFFAHRNLMLPPLKQLALETTAADYANWHAAAKWLDPQRPAPVLVTGLPRSGTTLLAKLLDTHSQVTTADEFDLVSRLLLPMLLGGGKPSDLSPEFLNRIDQEQISSIRHSHQVLFASALPESRDASILVDKNPSLFPLLTPWFRLQAGERVIVVLRDPRDLLVSCWMTYLPLNDFSVDFLSLDDAVDRIEADVQCWLSIRDKLPPGTWHQVWYEDLVANSTAEMEKLFHFLSLDPTKCNQSLAKSNVYSPTYAEVARPIYTDAIGRWKHYRDQLGDYLPRLERLARAMKEGSHT